MANDEVKEIINDAPETEIQEPAETDFATLLEGVDLNKLLEFDSVKKLVQAQSDKRVTQAIGTARQKWEAAQEKKATEAKKLEQMTETEQERYKLDQERTELETQKAAFAHAQLVVETQKQMISAGLPDLAQYVAGQDAEETNANLAAVSKALATWKAKILNEAMRGKAPRDTNPNDSGAKLTAADLKKMSPAEINAAWAAGKIDTTNL